MSTGNQRRRATASQARSAGILASIPFLLAAGCTRITVDPSCPERLAVGESGPVAANEKQPGHIATYLWEVTPASAGTFADAAAPDTTFQAAEAGEATLRMTAGDGLYISVGTCTVIITESRPTATLTAEPASVRPGGSTTLTCTTTGGTAPVTSVIDQLDGPDATLTQGDAGTATAVLDSEGDYTFRCIATDASGNASDPATVTVTATSVRPGGPR